MLEEIVSWSDINLARSRCDLFRNLVERHGLGPLFTVGDDGKSELVGVGHDEFLLLGCDGDPASDLPGRQVEESCKSLGDQTCVATWVV